MLRQARPTLPAQHLDAAHAAVATIAAAVRDQLHNGSTEASQRARTAAHTLQDDTVLWNSLSNQSNLPGARNVLVHVRTDSLEDDDGPSTSAAANGSANRWGDASTSTATQSQAEIQPAQAPHIQTDGAMAEHKPREVYTVDELADLNRFQPSLRESGRTNSNVGATPSMGAASRRSGATAATARTKQAAPPPSEVPTLGAGTNDATDSASANALDQGDASGHGSSIMHSTLPSLPNVASMTLSQAGADAPSRALSQPPETLPEDEEYVPREPGLRSASRARSTLVAAESGSVWWALRDALDGWAALDPPQPFAGRYFLGHERKEGRSVLVAYATLAEDPTLRYALKCAC